MTDQAILAARGISFTYKGSPTPALQNVSLTVAKGEIIGLIGPNGAGKTTLLAVCTMLLPPDSGSLHIAGGDGLQRQSKIKGSIGLVPQELALYERLTGWENLQFFGRMYGLAGPLLRERAAGYLEMFGLTGKRHQQVATYSGGMKRRLNLIIGLLHNPPLLFLDEPTVGVDAQSRHLIMERLAELNAGGTAMVYASHYLEEVQKLCRRIIIIDCGRIIGEGSPESMVAEAGGCGSLAELYLKKTGTAVRE